jgi:hypothetical protein
MVPGRLSCKREAGCTSLSGVGAGLIRLFIAGLAIGCEILMHKRKAFPESTRAFCEVFRGFL